jgi:hypothetical protein
LHCICYLCWCCCCCCCCCCWEGQDGEVICHQKGKVQERFRSTSFISQPPVIHQTFISHQGASWNVVNSELKSIGGQSAGRGVFAKFRRAGWLYTQLGIEASSNRSLIKQKIFIISMSIVITFMFTSQLSLCKPLTILIIIIKRSNETKYKFDTRKQMQLTLNGLPLGRVGDFNIITSS